MAELAGWTGAYRVTWSDFACREECRSTVQYFPLVAISFAFLTCTELPEELDEHVFVHVHCIEQCFGTDHRFVRAEISHKPQRVEESLVSWLPVSAL